jgi:hypothetical protein
MSGNTLGVFKNNNLIDYLFVALFVFIVCITVIVWLNTENTISVFEQTINGLKNDSLLIVHASSALDTMCFSSNQRIVVINNSNNAITNQKMEHVQKVKEKLKETKKYILDANSISYLFQVLSFLILGLGLYLLDKGKKAIQEAEKYSSKIKTIQETNTLTRFCESINYLSLQLQPDKLQGDKYNSENMKLCHLISRKSEETKDFIEDNQIYRITNEQEKKLLSELISDVKQKFDTMDLSKINGYYRDVYSIIDKLLERIQRLKHDLK